MSVRSYRPLCEGRKVREYPPFFSTWGALTSPEAQGPFEVFERLGRKHELLGLGLHKLREATKWVTRLVTSPSLR